MPVYPPNPPSPPTWAELQQQAAAAGYTLCFESPGGYAYLTTATGPTACILGDVTHAFEPGLTFYELEEAMNAYFDSLP